MMMVWRRGREGEGCVDGKMDRKGGKKTCYVIKITKQSPAEGLSLPLLP